LPQPPLWLEKTCELTSTACAPRAQRSSKPGLAHATSVSNNREQTEYSDRTAMNSRLAVSSPWPLAIVMQTRHVPAGYVSGELAATTRGRSSSVPGYHRPPPSKAALTCKGEGERWNPEQATHHVGTVRVDPRVCGPLFPNTVRFLFHHFDQILTPDDSGWKLSCTASGPQLHGPQRSTGLRPIPPHYSRDLALGPGAGSGLLPRLRGRCPRGHRPRARVPLVVWAWDFLLCGVLTAVSRPLL
jgi:hypothetical protein